MILYNCHEQEWVFASLKHLYKIECILNTKGSPETPWNSDTFAKNLPRCALSTRKFCWLCELPPKLFHGEVMWLGDVCTLLGSLSHAGPRFYSSCMRSPPKRVADVCSVVECCENERQMKWWDSQIFECWPSWKPGSLARPICHGLLADLGPSSRGGWYSIICRIYYNIIILCIIYWYLF